MKCTSTTSCWAVGQSYRIVGSEDETDFRALLEHWDGHSWSLVHAPAPSGAETVFRAIACAQTTCVAAGSYANWKNPGIAPKPFVDRDSGHGWITDTVVVPPAHLGELLGAACASATTCVAVGDVPANTQTQYRTLVERRG